MKEDRFGGFNGGSGRWHRRFMMRKVAVGDSRGGDLYGEKDNEDGDVAFASVDLRGNEEEVCGGVRD